MLLAAVTISVVGFVWGFAWCLCRAAQMRDEEVRIMPVGMHVITGAITPPRKKKTRRGAAR